MTDITASTLVEAVARAIDPVAFAGDLAPIGMKAHRRAAARENSRAALAAVAKSVGNDHDIRFCARVAQDEADIRNPEQQRMGVAALNRTSAILRALAEVASNEPGSKRD